jgi:hypothetical protein
MEVGAYYFGTDQSMGPAEMAMEVEARGFESLWVPEHTHVPVSRETPYPGGGELPDQYRRCLDPSLSFRRARMSSSVIARRLRRRPCPHERSPATKTPPSTALLASVRGAR